MKRREQIWGEGKEYHDMAGWELTWDQRRRRRGIWKKGFRHGSGEKVGLVSGIGERRGKEAVREGNERSEEKMRPRDPVQSVSFMAFLQASEVLG